MKYLLWSKLYKQWYCAPKEGLTLDIDNAGRYSEKEAESLIREVSFEVTMSASNGPNLVVKVQVVEGEK